MRRTVCTITVRTITAASLLALCSGCHQHQRESARRTNTTSSDSTSYTSSTSYSGPSGSASMAASSADARILSILHAKNQEEIQAGRLAQQNGAMDSVRMYGQHLVQDHTDADAKVMSTARAANVSLMTPDQTKQMMAREKGEGMPRDPIAELSSLRGPDFDRSFAQRMTDGHRELIQTVESAQPSVRDGRVRDLLSQMLPTLRDHERMAMNLNVR